MREIRPRGVFFCSFFLVIRRKREYNESMNYVYIVKCGDGSLYTGWTNDLQKRLKKHNAGKGAKYPRSRLPVELVYFETFETPREAQSREWHIKKLPREEKRRLIEKKL